MWIRVLELGEGSYGFVSLARSVGFRDEIEVRLGLPREFAVKSAEFSVSSNLQYEREVLRNFQDCPNVIRCYGADTSEEDDAIYYNVMLEFAAGGSLVDRIYHCESPLLEDEVKRHTKSILVGLSHIHHKGFAHCDIKPGNILLVDDGAGNDVAKIADFGLAIRVQKRSTPRERKMGWRGTCEFMAPESLLFDEYGCGVDIWGLGCTVYQMLTKKCLKNWDRDEEDKEEALERMANEEIEIPKWLSKDARDFLEKCLNKNTVLRWTANMLLGHPFIKFLDKEISSKDDIFKASTSSNSTDDEASEEDVEWQMKPMLLLDPLAIRKQQKRKRVVAEDSVSPECSSLWKKRSKIMDNNAQVQVHKAMKWPNNANEGLLPRFLVRV